MIELVDLRKEYKQGNDTVEALKKVNLSLPDTGLVFILGKSGSGKSTLLNMLGSLDDITSGDILVDGASLSKLSERELNVYRSDYISVIYQNFNLFESDTVYENVLVGARLLGESKKALQPKIEEIIKKVDLEDKTHILVKNLSGGQKQRVAIARALVKNSKVLLADEPTGNLDTKNTKIIFDILKDISKEKLVVVVSHDMKSAEA